MSKTRFGEIKETVRKYQRKADSYISSYCEKMENARNRYSPQVFQTQSMDIWAHHTGCLGADRDCALGDIDRIAADIRSDFKRWMVRPVNADLLRTMDSLRNYEIKLSRPELDVLREEVNDSFFGLKILSEISKESGYFIKTPSMSDFMNKLNAAVDSAKTAVECYCGSSPFPGADLLGTWKVGGVDLGDFPVWRRLYASNYLAKDTTLQEAEKAWAAASVPATLELTQSEQKRIYDLVGNIKGEKEKRDRIEEIAAVEPDFKEKLSLLSGDYKAAVEKYLDTGKVGYVSDNDGETIV